MLYLIPKNEVNVSKLAKLGAEYIAYGAYGPDEEIQNPTKDDLESLLRSYLKLNIRIQGKVILKNGPEKEFYMESDNKNLRIYADDDAAEYLAKKIREPTPK